MIPKIKRYTKKQIQEAISWLKETQELTKKYLDKEIYF